MNGPGRRLGWKSGGIWLLLSTLLVLAVLAWRGPVLLDLLRRRPSDADPSVVHGFNVADAGVPRELIVSSGVAAGSIRALDDPEVMTSAEMAALYSGRRTKYLTSVDPVVGVVIAGEARAYPLRVLNWHEVVNDTLGGRPIAVTYHPLCGSVVVFDRRIGERVAEFGVSGVLFNSNLLMFDSREPGGPRSLWSQLGTRAISGPALGGPAARILPASLAYWSEWIAAHPETTVLRPDPQYRKRYRRDPYGNYLRNGTPRYPVEPLPDPAGQRPWMSPLIAFVAPGNDRFSTLFLDGDDFIGALQRELPGTAVKLPPPGGGGFPSIVLPDSAETPTIYSLWFAWNARDGADRSARIRSPENDS